MGDGSGSFWRPLTPIEKARERVPSQGDRCDRLQPWRRFAHGAAEVKSNPQAAKGMLVEGVLRDGDWNIAQKWEGDNGIKNNPDEKTWDPDAVNWLNASDYNVAAADYVAGKCDDRKVVKDGILPERLSTFA